MKRETCALTLGVILTVALAMSLTASALSQTETILHAFTGGSDGSAPESSLIFDANGNLYGTTSTGGSGTYLSGAGPVYELAKGSNGAWTESVIYAFGSSADDLLFPYGHLVFDNKGNLYGTAGAGLSSLAPYGGVFELSPGSNGTWTETVLYAFTGGPEGQSPGDGIVLDSAGNMYGVASGGVYGYGVVFELTLGGNGIWKEKVLHSFTGNDDGAGPSGRLAIDKAGNVYGVTDAGGPHDYGVVFELTPGSNGHWTEKVVHAFTGGPGGVGWYGGLTIDGAGNLYDAGDYFAFEFSPQTNGTWSENVLHDFTGGQDGAISNGELAFDKAGNLYGTTFRGGMHHGTVYKLIPESNGAWTEKILHRFSANGTDGVFPNGPGLVVDSSGSVYGVTQQGGTSNLGVVFQITP